MNVYLQEFIYNENACERWMMRANDGWCVGMKDVDYENEWVDVIVCASIDSAVSLRTEALSSVAVSYVKWMLMSVVVVLSVGVKMVV